MVDRGPIGGDGVSKRLKIRKWMRANLHRQAWRGVGSGSVKGERLSESRGPRSPSRNASGLAAGLLERLSDLQQKILID